MVVQMCTTWKKAKSKSGLIWKWYKFRCDVKWKPIFFPLKFQDFRFKFSILLDGIRENVQFIDIPIWIFSYISTQKPYPQCRIHIFCTRKENKKQTLSGTSQNVSYWSRLISWEWSMGTQLNNNNVTCETNISYIVFLTVKRGSLSFIQIAT